jgi:polyvinyl alcohol dehydrogenase (cytochrome)
MLNRGFRPRVARLVPPILMALAALGAAPGAHAGQGDGSQWSMGGQDIDNARHQAKEHHISPANAASLTKKWEFTTGGDVSATPTVVGGALYVPDRAGNLYKIDAETGALVWSRTIASYTGVPGDHSRTSPALVGNRLFLATQLGARVLAVDADTGNLLWSTLVDAHFAGAITQSPVVHANTVYVGVSSLEELAAANPFYLCCTFRGSVVALNATTGAVKWKTHTTADNGGAPGGYSGASVWGSTPVVDTRRGLLYVTSGNNYTVPASVALCVAGGGGIGCNDPRNRFDSVIALDLKTGAVRWSTFAESYDAWTVACFFGVPNNCPTPTGPDYDFASGPNLFTVRGGGPARDIVGAGQKSGVYWALNPDDGQLVWKTQVGPGGEVGGIQWGSAVDGTRIYVAIANSRLQPHPLPGLPGHIGGSFSALDAATGQILWQTPEAVGAPFCPVGCPPPPGPVAPVTVANGVVYGATLTGFYRALDAATGGLLWSYPAGGSVGGGAAVVRGTVYWGSGFGHFGPLLGTSHNKLHAFSVD